MNEELKKYINAYIDGEEVDWRYETQDTASMWHTVSGLSDFESDTKHSGIKHFRIKPKAEDKWERIIDEGYLCKFWDYDEAEGFIDYLHSFQDKGFIRRDGEALWNYCEVLQEKGHKQPYFQGDDIPEIDGKVVVYFKNGEIDVREVTPDGFYWVDWSEVVAYIEV